MRASFTIGGIIILLLHLPASGGAETGKPADVDHQRLLNADNEPGNWMSWGRTYNEDRYSPLDQINDSNVTSLSLAWYYTFNNHRGNETTQMVVEDVLYTSIA